MQSADGEDVHSPGAHERLGDFGSERRLPAQEHGPLQAQRFVLSGKTARERALRPAAEPVGDRLPHDGWLQFPVARSFDLHLVLDAAKFQVMRVVENSVGNRQRRLQSDSREFNVLAAGEMSRQQARRSRQHRAEDRAPFPAPNTDGAEFNFRQRVIRFVSPGQRHSLRRHFGDAAADGNQRRAILQQHANVLRRHDIGARRHVQPPQEEHGGRKQKRTHSAGQQRAENEDESRNKCRRQPRRKKISKHDAGAVEERHRQQRPFHAGGVCVRELKKSRASCSPLRPSCRGRPAVFLSRWCGACECGFPRLGGAYVQGLFFGRAVID